MNVVLTSPASGTTTQATAEPSLRIANGSKIYGGVHAIEDLGR